MALPRALRDLFTPVYNVTMEYTPAVQSYVAGMDTARLYETQPNLRAVVSFLADSIAQLPVRTYYRVSDTDRESATGSTLALLLEQPNPDQTCYEFMNATMVEYLLYGQCVWWIVKSAETPSGYELRVVPSNWITGSQKLTAYAPDVIRVSTKNGHSVDIPRDEFVMMRQYRPGTPGSYCSPVESLKTTLAEQVEAERFRREVWKSSGRFNAYLSRPAGVEWEPAARERFVLDFREAWGSKGENAGKMPLLEDGMKIESAPFNAKEAQWVESVQLARQDCAAAYHLNPSLIWHDSSQTYASARDNARALYSDTLGSPIRMLEQKCTHDLAPKIGEPANAYVELDLSEKLRGNFEEQASVLQSAVGAPWMTRDEARSRANLPPIEGGDELVTPLNVIAGGLASPNDTDPTVERYNGIKSAPVEVKVRGNPDEREREKIERILKRFFKRCGKSVLPKINTDADWWDEDRWIDELTSDLIPAVYDVADTHGYVAAASIGTEYVPELTGKYLAEFSGGKATAIVKSTKRKLDEALAYEPVEDEEPPESMTPEGVFDICERDESPRMGVTLATAVAGWAVLEAARQASRQGKTGIMKTWIHVPGSKSSRPEHEAMDGETVPYDAPFSNGFQWTGDDLGDAADWANCYCQIEVTVP